MSSVQPESVAENPVPRPWGVWFISVVVGLEALGLLIVAVTFLLGLFTAQPSSVSGAVFLTIMLFLLGAGLAAVATQHFRGFRWSRAAALVWQLVMLTIGVPTLLSGQLLIGLLLLVPPLAVLFLLFTPAVVAFTLRQNNSSAL